MAKKAKKSAKKKKKGTARPSRSAVKRAQKKQAQPKKLPAKKLPAKKPPPTKPAKAAAPKPPAKKTVRRRPLRIKKHKGPLQMGLPLQMPFAFGREAYAERPVDAAPGVDDKGAARAERTQPAGEQTALFE